MKHEPGFHRSQTLRGLCMAALLGMAGTLPATAIAQNGSALFAVDAGSSRAAGKPAAGKAPVTKPAGAPKAAAKSATASKPTASSKTAASAKQAASSKPATDKAGKAGNRNASRTAARKPAGPLTLAGRWQDAQCLPAASTTRADGLYVQRQYQFDDKRKGWQMEATVFADNHCSAATRLLTYRGEGSFTLAGRSNVATGAWNANFRIDRWQATPANRDGVMAMLNARCGSGDFETGQPLDLSRTGCAPLGIQSIAQRPSELELVRIADGKFYLGSRSFLPASGDERPAQLSSYGLERAPN